MRISNKLKPHQKYGFLVLVTIVLTFVAVILAIFFTIKPLMTREERGRVAGSINTLTNFCIDNTSLVRESASDTLYTYRSQIIDGEYSRVAEKIIKRNGGICEIAFKNPNSDNLFTSGVIIDTLLRRDGLTDAMVEECVKLRHVLCIVQEYDGQKYYLSSYPVFSEQNNPVSVCFLLFSFNSIYDLLEKHNPYKKGKMYIVQGQKDSLDTNILDFSLNMQSLDEIRELYGSDAVDVVLKAYNNPNKEGFIMSNKDYYLYSKYDNLYYYLFFYAVDKHFVSHDIRVSFIVLLFVCLAASFVIIYTCLKNMRELSEKTIDEAQRRKDIETAASIQMSMLPHDDNSHLMIDIGSRLIPAKGVGGDLFYHWIRNGRLYFCVGDISGKGIPASLYMSKTISLFHIIASHDYSASKIASKLNSELCLNNDNAVFLTLFIGILDLRTNELTYCNAGHDEPIYWDGDASHNPTYLSTSGNCPIGFDEENQFIEGKIRLAPDYLLIMYTDGINEAKNDKLAMYGFDRILESINKSKELSSDEINTALLEDVSKFVGKHEQSDDMTLLTLKHRSASKSITIKNSRKQLRKISPFLKDVFSETGVSDELSNKLRIGIDEAMTNAVCYAYQDNGSISLSASFDDNKLIFVIEDDGVEFNPLSYSQDDDNPDKIGGLGISIIKKAFDTLEYRREGDTNKLQLIKIL